jgi:sterol desaturase/sphingolipid hydroxylase (fatty acid hydroxylase superfamily)
MTAAVLACRNACRLLYLKCMRAKVDRHIPTLWWGLVVAALFLSLAIPTTLPGIAAALQELDMIYYIFLAIPAVITLLALREAWHYLTHQ